MIEQIGIAITGAIAVWLTQDWRPSRQRFACIFGMLGQPFWFWAAIKAHQYGVLIVCLMYTVAWYRGLLRHWIAPLLAKREP